MARILYLTDLYYPAKGRNYYEEDIFIAGRLMDHFDVALCHPKNSEAFEDSADVIVFRNTGSVIGYKEIYRAFRERIQKNSLRTFNTFTGKADMLGKDYLLELTKLGFPVIPTVECKSDISLLPASDRYVIKPKDGADSIGLEFLSDEELSQRHIADHVYLIQPAVEFEYEVSFYFIDNKFEYAMYAPDKTKRWEMVPYHASEEDIRFAERFISWNSISHGIQRVDACRTTEGELLLIELEDLNPYLSLLQTETDTQEKFIADLVSALKNCLKEQTPEL